MILLCLHAGIASSFSLLSKVYLRALSYYFRLQALSLISYFVLIYYHITLSCMGVSLIFNNFFNFMFFLIWIFINQFNRSIVGAIILIYFDFFSLLNLFVKFNMLLLNFRIFLINLLVLYYFYLIIIISKKKLIQI